MDPATLTTIFIALITSVISSILAFFVQERRLKHNLEVKLQEVKTEHMAEMAAKNLLEHKGFDLRSFELISKRIRGFNDDELRKILVRAGAVCFEDEQGKELWGLLERNPERVDAGYRTDG